MAEPDHIFLRPFPNFMKGDKPAAYNFGLDPAREETCLIVKRCDKSDDEQYNLRHLCKDVGLLTFFDWSSLRKGALSNTATPLFIAGAPAVVQFTGLPPPLN